jgi:hypothetical protein
MGSILYVVRPQVSQAEKKFWDTLGSELRLRFLWKLGVFLSVTPAVAGIFAFGIDSKAHARSAAVGEFYAGRLESLSERRHGRTVRSQYAGSAFQALYGR